MHNDDHTVSLAIKSFYGWYPPQWGRKVACFCSSVLKRPSEWLSFPVVSPWLFQPSSIYHWQRERRQFILFISPSLLTFLFSPFTLFAKSQWSYDLILESLDVNKFCNGEGILQLFSFRARVFWHLYLIAPIFYFSLSLCHFYLSFLLFICSLSISSLTWTQKW